MKFSSIPGGMNGHEKDKILSVSVHPAGVATRIHTRATNKPDSVRLVTAPLFQKRMLRKHLAVLGLEIKYRSRFNEETEEHLPSGPFCPIGVRHGQKKGRILSVP